MIITKMLGGLGNQMFQYAVGRRLAYHLNTNLKIDKSPFDSYTIRKFQLDDFNIKEDFATTEEIKSIIEKSQQNITSRGLERNISAQGFMPEVLDYPDDTYLVGDWQCENYFIDIENVIREEFTLKKELLPDINHWIDKINSTNCAVALHIRHGDYAFDPKFRHLFGILPINYYKTCVDMLKKKFGAITVFIFSDDLEWVKANLNLNVPMEFVDDVPRDSEEIYLMSLCKHNIIANSSFSWWGAWLNRNPNKKVFVPDPWFRMPVGHKDIVPKNYTKVTVDFNQGPDIDIPPVFSFVIFIENEASTIVQTFDSILSQNYKFYEVIIIDNNSTDRSSKICNQIAKKRPNFHYKRIENDKINKFVAWNMGIDISQGKYILFLTGKDWILPNALHILYFVNESINADVLHSIGYFKEDSNGNFTIANRKFNLSVDEPFRELKDTIHFNVQEDQKIKIWTYGKLNTLISAKMFKRNFLIENAIKFKEKIQNNVEELFLMECSCCTSRYFVTPQVVNVVSDTEH